MSKSKTLSLSLFLRLWQKVGSGMRPWKRVFSVLRSQSLFLYKDKREAVLRGAEDEQPISIRGCLVDIAYSETKRKHALRLTTQDFCEYLLQAEGQDQMLDWIQVIRENSKTDSEVGIGVKTAVCWRQNCIVSIFVKVFFFLIAIRCFQSNILYFLAKCDIFFFFFK